MLEGKLGDQMASAERGELGKVREVRAVRLGADPREPRACGRCAAFALKETGSHWRISNNGVI